MDVPLALQRQWSEETDWLASLPHLTAECAARWSLRLETPIDTPYSLVIPAGEFVLKLNAPSHSEADQEAAALECWAGDGAVRLIAHDETRRALLIERCRPGTRLWDGDVDEYVLVQKLMPRLWVEPHECHPFRNVADEAERWAQHLANCYARSGRPFESSLVGLAIDVFNSVDRTARFLVNQDLHGGNILRSEREAWLVVDPKPLVGEREVTAVGLLRNAVSRGGQAAITKWLDVLEELDLDRGRLRGWGVAHALAWGCDVKARWLPASIDAARAVYATS